MAPPGKLVRGPFASLANGSVVADGLRAIGVQEHALDKLAGTCFHASVVEHELFGFPGIAVFLQAGCQLGEGLVPGNPLPFALPPFAHALHGVEDPVGEIDLVDAGLAL